MRVIVSVQSKRGSSRGLVHYLSHSKIDTSKELSGGRELFNIYSDSIDVTKANIFLKSGTSTKRPSNDELHHFVLSLKPDDYEKLGVDEKERLRSVKEITRHAMSKFEKAIGADTITWAASVHRNTQNPHVHIALQKQFFDQSLDNKTLTQIPKECLPHYERTGNEKTFASGVLIDAANEKLEEIIIERSKILEERSLITEEQNRSKNTAESRQNTQNENNEKKVLNDSHNFSVISHERDILARALIGKHFLDRSEQKLESIVENGHIRRFLIFDAVTNQKRKMSLLDFNRRADELASREIKNLKITDSTKITELKKNFLDAEFSQNAAGIKQIRTILFKTATREESIRQQLENDYKLVRPEANKIRSAYRRENKKLPNPSLTKDELDLLQEAGLANHDLRAVNYVERVRVELVNDGEIPARTTEDIQRLNATRMICDLRCQLKEKHLQAFNDRLHGFNVEIGRDKWSLSKIERLVREEENHEPTWISRIGTIFQKEPLPESDSRNSRYADIKRTIIEAFEDKSRELRSELNREKNAAKTLDSIYKNDPISDKETIAAKFDAQQLAEIETLAFQLKLPKVYEQNWLDQKSFISRAGPDSTESRSEKHPSFKKESSQSSRQHTLLAGRAIARQVMCEVELMKATDLFVKFRKTKHLQKFELADNKTGEIRFVNLAEVEIRRHGSIFDQALDYFLEDRERRSTRNTLKSIIKEKEKELKTEVRAAKEMLATASKETVDYKKRKLFGPNVFTSSPIFTPQEMVVIESRTQRTDNKFEAQKLQALLDVRDVDTSRSLSNLLSSFSSRKENIENREAEVIEARKFRNAIPNPEMDQDRLQGATDGPKKPNSHFKSPEQDRLAPRRDDDRWKTIR
ncbi:MAG: relaxase MobL [Pyrinomonadaceae bacterium]